MRIVVNHLTRMRQGCFCVAGLDLDSGAHVRPIVPDQQLQTTLLARHGGPFDMGVIIDLGPVTPTPQPPEVEDHAFDRTRAKALGTEEPRRFWERLRQVARPKLRDLFGNDLIQRGSMSCAIDMGKGGASLGCLVPTGSPVLYTRARPGKPDEIRMGLSDGSFRLDLGVTDIRLYGADHVTPDTEVVRRIAKRLEGGTDVVLSVGVTRAYGGSRGYDPVHWLQLNNVHLGDDPLWQLG